MSSSVKSLCITGIVSALFALLLTKIQLSVYIVFTLITVLQFVVWHVATRYINSNITSTAGDMYLKVVEAGRQTKEVSCAGCDSVNDVEIKLNEENAFTCVSCNRVNSVYIDIETVIRTIPVSVK